MFDLWILDTCKRAWLWSTPKVNAQVDWDDLSEILGPVALDGEDIYDSQFEIRATELLDERSEDLIIDQLLGMRTCKYYPKLLNLSTTMSRMAVSKEQYASRTTNLTIPDEENWCKSPEKYIGYLVVETSSAVRRLKTIVQGLRTLCTRIRTAAEKGELSPALSSALKLKVGALHESYEDALHGLGEPYRPLISPNSPEWW